MTKIHKTYNAEVEGTLKNGGIGILLTDTIYGIVGSTLNKKAVEKIYKVKKRPDEKPFIILISEMDELKKFGIDINEKQTKFLSRVWPGGVSVVLPCRLKKFKHLHRGIGSLSFRIPPKENLRKLIKSTGPLAAPSANISGEEPVASVEEAKTIFGDSVDFYVDEGPTQNTLPSTIIGFKDGEVDIIREGVVRKKEIDKLAN